MSDSGSMVQTAGIQSSRSAIQRGLAVAAPGRQRRASRLSDIWKAPLSDLPIRDEILYQYLPLSPQLEVLEVGPGTGFTAYRLARLVKSLTIVDVAAPNIARLRKSLSLPNVELVCADLCAPDFPRFFNVNTMLSRRSRF